MKKYINTYNTSLYALLATPKFMISQKSNKFTFFIPHSYVKLHGIYNAQTMIATLTDILPPDRKAFEKIAKDYISESHETIAKELKARGYPELVETLAIFRLQLEEKKWWWSFRRIIQKAYSHYLANTDGLIPEKDDQEQDDFDPIKWARDYGKSMNAQIVEIEEKDEAGNVHNKIEIVVRRKRVVLEERFPIEGTSAASVFRKIAQVINQARYKRDQAIPAYLFPFDGKDHSYKHEHAIWMGELSLLAYYSRAFIEEQLKQWGYKNFKWINHEESDTQCFLVEKTDHIVLCFRGTSSMKDALTDLKIRKVKEDDKGRNIKIHQGFAQAINYVWEEILDAVKDLDTHNDIFVCGHSLGGALSKLAALRLTKEGHCIGGVYTFGAPRIGNKNYADHYEKYLGLQTFLLINNKDIIPQIPPNILGFRHVGAEIKHFGDDHQIISEQQGRSIGSSRSVKTASTERVEALTTAQIYQVEQAFASAMQSTIQLRNEVSDEYIPINKDVMTSRGLVDDHSMFEYIYKVGVNILEGKI